MTTPFTSTIGSPQGGGLSPVLFAIYLDAAIRELIARGPTCPQHDLDVHLPHAAIYADDTNFISLCSKFLDDIQLAVRPIFIGFEVLVNAEKTERTIIGHQDGVEEDVNIRLV